MRAVPGTLGVPVHIAQRQ